MHIGGIDSAVVKNPRSNLPYIPGSSFKGKMRSLLELRSGAILVSKGAPISYANYQSATASNREQLLAILQLFGCSGSDQLSDSEALKIGPTRLSFWDCDLDSEWLDKLKETGSSYQPEEKSENSINRISSEATNPRFIERVPAGCWFDFRLTIKTFDNDSQKLMNTLLTGLKLLELDGIGGSGSRGYGKIKFHQLTLDKEPIDQQLNELIL